MQTAHKRRTTLMLAVTRKAKIREIISEKKSVTVTELSREFGVTEETIRRDLKQLEEDGFLTRTYGGAFIQDGVENDIDTAIRETAYTDSKETIAARCLEIIRNGDSIFLDSSTTSLFLARALRDMRLTVVTNSLLIINELSGCSSIRLIALGGNYSAKDQAFIGSRTINSLKNFYMDKAFLSCRSLSMEHGISDSSESTSAIRQTLLDQSDSVYLIADHSKFDKTSFIRICGFERITGLVTDFSLTEQWAHFLEKAGVTVFPCL